MSGLFGGGGDINTTSPVIGSLRLQTSCYGKPVPWLFGKGRVSPNIVQFEDFTAIAHTSSQSAGGKGGGPTMSNTTYTYTVAPIMALCSGPIASVGRVWKDKSVSDVASIKLDVFIGDTVQQPHPYFVGAHPDRALSYRGFAYVASGAYDLGENANLENHSFEVQMPGAIGGSVPDADPKDVITAILTDTEQGLARPADKIDGLSQFSDFCRASGIWVSPAYIEQKPAYEYIRNLLQIGFADCVYSGGVFKIVPYSDAAVTSDTGSYTPAIAPAYALSDDNGDYLGDAGNDPIKVTRKSQTDAYNLVQVKYLDRSNDYNEAVAEAKDEADIDQFGERAMEPVELHEICDAHTAQQVAEFLLRRSLYVRNEYEFVLPWSYVLLEPMDVVTITRALSHLAGVPVMIVSIEETDADDGLHVVAEDFPLGSNSVGTITPPAAGGYTPDYSVAPGNSTIPVMFEPPLQLTSGDPQLWLAAAGGEHWGGADVWVSTDNASYRKIGRMQGPSRYGSLSAPLAAGAAIDTLNVAAVDFSASRGTLQSGTEQNAQDLVTLCYVGGEYIAYATADLTGVNTYDLSYLVRGAYGTDVAAHAAGAPFVRIDDGLFRYSYPKEWLGKTLWVKLVSFNQFGGGLQDMSTVPAYQVTLEGAPLAAVANLRFEQEWIGRDARIAWDLLDGADSYDVQVYAGAPSTLVRAMGGITNPRYVYTAEDMLSDGGPWRDVVFKVRGRSITGNTGQFAQLLAHNAQIGALTGIQIDRGIGAVFFRCTRPTDGDFAGILVWISSDSACPAVDGNLVADATGTVFPIARLADGTPLAGGVTYYLRAAAYDEFGRDGLNLSSVLSVSPYSAAITEFDLDPALYQPIAQAVDAANQSTPEALLQALLDADAGRRIGQGNIASVAIAQQTLESHADAIHAEATAREILAGQFGNNIASLQIEQQALADSNSATASSVTTLTARLDTGDYAAVKEESSVTADKLGNIEAKHVLQVDANGHVAGMELLSTGAGSQIVMLADRFVWLLPDGSGVPVQLMAAWSDPADGQTKLGVSGDLLVAGTIAGDRLVANTITADELAANSVTATKLAASAVTADKIAAGAVTADKVTVTNLAAISANLGAITGGSLNINNKFIVGSDGTTTIQSAASGQRVVTTNSQVQVYDSNGTLRVRMGIW
jgi:hypothetical protein